MKRLVLFLLGFVLAAVVLYRKRSAVLNTTAVLLYMTVFSVMLSPVCIKLEKRGFRPALAAGFAVIGLFLIVLLILASFIPYMIEQMEFLLKRVSPAATGLMELLMRWKNGWEGIGPAWMDSGNMIPVAVSDITSKLIKSGMYAVKQIGRIGFALVLTYYVLCERKLVGNHLLMIIPILWRNPILCALRACRNAMMSYFCGLFKTSMFVSAATFVGLCVLGVQDAVLLALLMGVLEILPYIGPLLASIPILLSALMQGGKTAVFALIMLVAIQQVEGNFVSPYFTASSTSIHPLAAILAVFVMGSLMGIWGILLAVPLLILCQSLALSLRQMRLAIKDGILSA